MCSYVKYFTFLNINNIFLIVFFNEKYYKLKLNLFLHLKYGLFGVFKSGNKNTLIETVNFPKKYLEKYHP
jgi:hypothetical protein